MSIIKVKPSKIKYIQFDDIDKNYTTKMDSSYNWMAKIYDLFMFFFPLWKRWISTVIPHIQGEKILEVSFGSGYLMTQYAKSIDEIHGVDFNQKMQELTLRKMKQIHTNFDLKIGNVEQLPYPDNTFDTVINTMALSGYSDGNKAISELKRVLKKEGRLLLVDFDYPKNRNVFGYLIVRLWEKMGDIIKDIENLLQTNKLYFTKKEIGGFGSVHFYIAHK